MALATRKELGQHWLHDPLVIRRIADACTEGLPRGASLLEIGPGAGALTRVLLEDGVRLHALEIDPRCVAELTSWPAASAGQLTVHPGDALKTDWPALLSHVGQGGVGGASPAVVGNLPYNVGTEIVARLLLLPQPPVRMVFLLQKEVVQRITAQPGTEHWGRLGVLTGLLAKSRRLFDVAPGAFTPPPKVMSSVVEILPRPQRLYDVNLAQLDVVLRAGFGQRRKMLRSALKGVLNEAHIEACDIEPTARMETLDLAALCRLARQLASFNQP